MTSNFAVTTTNTPIFNRSDWNEIYGAKDGSLPLDDQKLLRCVETVLFPETSLRVLEKMDDHIVKVKANEYPHSGHLYTDTRFLEFRQEQPVERKKNVPTISEIVSFFEMLEKNSTRYIWGGNCYQGIPELLDFYPPKLSLEDESIKDIWTLKGCDCSGMLYEATNGRTPRNTSSLVTFGLPILIKKLSIEEICKSVQPLDIVAWKGHVFVVLSGEYVIESLGGKGVVKSKLFDRLSELSEKEFIPVNFYNSVEKGNRYVIRRWHDETLPKQLRSGGFMSIA